MADLFLKQAAKYVETRPSYPPELFQFIASKCPRLSLAWDVGTGNGQAAATLAGIFDRVVATDTSENQLAHATRLPNIIYRRTPHSASPSDVAEDPGTVDLITVAQAVHWLGHVAFYSTCRTLLRRPGGVVAPWCYTVPRASDRVDPVYDRVYRDSAAYWAPQRRLVDEELRTLWFPFRPVPGEEHTGPFRFETTREMDLRAYLTYIRSWSAYQTAADQGVELLTDEVVSDFLDAWGGDAEEVKVIRFPIFLRLGSVGPLDEENLHSPPNQNGVVDH